MQTPCEKNKNKAVPMRKELPIKTVPILDVKNYVYDVKSITNLLRLVKRLMQDGKRYSVSLKIQENEN